MWEICILQVQDLADEARNYKNENRKCYRWFRSLGGVLQIRDLVIENRFRGCQTGTFIFAVELFLDVSGDELGQGSQILFMGQAMLVLGEANPQLWSAFFQGLKGNVTSP